jgi:hypothetical protein
MHFNQDQKSAIIPYTDALSYEEYVNLSDKHELYKELKRDMQEMEAQLNEAVKHLMFAMYLNWKQSILLDEERKGSFAK